MLDPNLFNPLAIFDESLFHERVPSISSDATNSDPGGLLGTLLLDQNTDPFRVVLPTINLPSPELPSTETITHLVDVFFNAVHPQFRLLHRPTLAQKLHDPSYLASKEAALLLNAIFALAARYSNDIRVELFDLSLLRHQSDISSPSNTSILNPSYQRKGRWELGHGFLQRAHRFLREEIAEEERLEHKTGETQEPRVELLQAAALLAFAELGMGISSRAHSMMSMCARMAYDMGLDSIDCEDFQSQLEPYLNKHSWIRKEELRRLWWCIWDLDNFMCTAKYRPRMICPIKCKTKLPVNDVDWFDGNEVPSFFLPSNVRQLPEFIQNHLLSSAAAYRIINCHLLATLTGMFSNIENLDEPSDIYSVVKVCTVLWKENLPKEFKDYSCKTHAQEPGEHSEILSDLFPMHIYCELIKLLLGTERMFKGITPAAISTYCQQYSNSSIGLAGIGVTPEAPSPAAQAFFNALSASKAICSIVRDWPSKYIIHTSPLVGGGILMAAFVQLLVKRFGRGTSDMAETASLSLRLLIMVVEQLGEYWGLCRTKLF
ncbi:hypothetical protein VE03_08087 [Pseudogymnoascus sp. 23342-1-I1]|nr:hypothetical protein VE03_08087 [Pseudogymnoascus sp. 23342-1-I1]